MRSEHLADGYWKRPDLTAANFLPDPDGGARRIHRTGDLGRFLADGSLAHLGRDDFQIKLRGHRVEVGEVESALLDHPGVCEAAVVGRPVDDGGMRLLGYAVARRDAALSARDLRAFLRDRLPDYRSRECSWSSARSRSCPTARWTARRCRTRRPTAPARRRRSPTPWRPSSWKCFADVLHVGEVGVHDDFFALGGDSLQAGQIASRLRERLAVDVPLATILERPTASELAVAVVHVMAHSGDPTGLSATLLAVERTARDQTARLL